MSVYAQACKHNQPFVYIIRLETRNEQLCDISKKEGLISKNEYYFKGKKLSLSKNISADINLTLSILLDIKNILNDKKIELSLVLVPRIYPLNDINNINFHNSFVELLKSNNFDYIDALELFEKNKPNKYMTWDNYHISTFYHKKITEILYKKLFNN